MTRWMALVEAWATDGSLAERLCLTLAHSLWQFGLLALLVWLVETIGRRLSFAARYNLCLALLLVGIAALPLTWITVRTPETSLPLATAPQTLPPATGGASQPAAADRALASSESDLSGAEPGTLQTAAISIAAVKASPQSPLAVATRWIAALYGLGVCLMLGRLARGVWRCQRTMRAAQPILNEALLVALGQLASRYKLRVQPRLAAAGELAMPCVMGLVRPMIIFPLAVLNSLSPVELEMILAHELAHVRRRDLWAHFVQRLTEAVLFFNPGMWYVSRRISLLREHCCDELACERLAADEVSPRMRYAQALVHLAELQFARSNRSEVEQLTSLAAASVSPSQLRRRIAVLLGEPVREPLRVSPSGLMSLVLFAIALFLAPPIVVSSGQQQSGATATEAVKPAVEGDPAIEEPRIDAVKVLAIGYGDTAGKSGATWWHTDGTPCDAPATPFNGRRNAILLKSPRGRRIVFELPEYRAGTAVRFKIESKSGWSRGELLASELDAAAGQPKILHEVHTIAPDDDEVMTLRVGRADGEWKTVYSGDAGAVAQGNNDLKGVVFSQTFSQGKGSAVVVSHNWHGQEARLIATDKSGKKQTGKFSSHLTAVETVNQTIFEFPGLKPDEIAEFDFQVQDFTWTTIDNLPANPKPAADAKATISGRIRLKDGSAPTQEGWLYTLHRKPNGNSSMVTHGSFTDQHTFTVPAGKLWLTYFTDDFAPATAGPFDIEPGQSLKDLDLVLRPGVTWHLKFQNDAGEPVVATVNAVPFIGDGLSGPVKPLTADAGILSLEHLTQSVAYQLSVSAAGYQPTSLNLPTNTVPPNPADSPIVITMRRARPATGVARLLNGEPARGSQLIIRAEVTPTSGIAHTNNGIPVDDEGRFSIDELADDKFYLVMAEGPDGARVMLPPVVAGRTGIEVKIPPRRDLKVHLIGDLDKLEQRKNEPTIRIGQRYTMRTAAGPSYGDYLGETVDVSATDDGGIAVYKGLIDAPIVVTVGKREHEFDGSESEVTIDLDEPPSKTPYKNRY